MRRIFTLAELLLVVIIISIIISALSFFSWKYVLRLRTQVDIRNFENFYSAIYGQTLGYFSKDCSKTGFVVVESGSKCVGFYIQSGTNKVLKRQICFNFSKIEGIKVNNIKVESGEFIFNSFNIGLKFKDNSGRFYTGGVVDILVESVIEHKHLKIILDIGKLFIL